MNPTAVDAATQALSSGAVAHDPLIVGLAWVAGIVALLISIGLPIRNYIRDQHRAAGEDRVVDAKSSAEATLYTHLSQQVEQYRKIADEAYKERNDLVGRVAALEAKTQVLEETKATLDRLKKKLEDKDIKIEEKDAEIRKLLTQAAEERQQFLSILQAKDAEITKRDERITSLEERQRELETRLMRDEISIGVVQCPFHGSGVVVSDTGLIPVPEASLTQGV